MIRWVAIPLPGSVASRHMMALKRSGESGAEEICGSGWQAADIGAFALLLRNRHSTQEALIRSRDDPARILQSCRAAGAKLYRGLLSLKRNRVSNRIMGSRGYGEGTPNAVLKTAASCWRRAAEAETQAAQISDRHLKAVYLRIADQWSVLARSYEFADSAERFLLDAKRTKDADAQQPSSADAQQPTRELVLLPVVAREWGSRGLAAGLCGWCPSAGGDTSTPTGRQCASEQGEPRQAQGQSSESLGRVLINRIRFTPNRMSPTLS
jgi:hypothetical protein